MPGVNPNSDAYVITFLREVDQRLRALETQQNSVWRDAEGRERVRVGLLPNGDYGLMVTDLLGYQREVFPTVVDATAELTYSGGTTWATPSAAAGNHVPAVTVLCGGSGKLDISLGATITPGSYSLGETAALAVTITGPGASGVYYPEIYISVGSNSTAASQAYAEWLHSGLTAGAEYTIAVVAWASTSGVVATYDEVSLRCTPV